VSPLHSVCNGCFRIFPKTEMTRGRCPDCAREANRQREAQPYRREYQRVHHSAEYRRVRKAVFERDNHRCVDCGTTEKLQLDLVVPLAAGGAITVENGATRCGSCNPRRTARLGR
jgi:5-methylcytosine-specific restriction endonuclease McrA